MLPPRETAPAARFQPRPPVIVVTSQVVNGAIGGRGAVFALERLGFPVWFVPTILLPWHPGQGPGTRIVPPAEDFARLIGDIAGGTGLGSCAAILTGYLGEAGQAAEVAKLVDALKAANPKAWHICDPVIGDGAGLYVPEATANAQREHLISRADIATPNRFELAWLTGLPVETEAEAIVAARTLGPERVIVTSSPALRRNSVCNLLVGPGGSLAAEHGLVINAPHGTGDLFSALFTARLLEGHGEEGALKRAAASTFELVARSVKQGSSELLLSSEQSSLVGPMALVSSRRILDRPKPA
ncbi:pyridoxal kinase [Stappia sp. F7233]|uniref:pyridoxal kinase n=1 Tax=Stappia albiluteola TaxID=2758565 RepID=A0A839AH10_9HYPH|nr:pyridoxal kinase [Stappia albiluteola]MBA5778983.1 pyridoxal kinase [Stappia albiluteola]